MKYLSHHIAAIGSVILLGAIYVVWFLKGGLSAPDFTHLYSERIGDYQWLPFAWSEVFGNGTGGNTFASLNLNMYLHSGIRILVFLLHIPWQTAAKILFFWPYVLIGSLGAFYAVSTIVTDRKLVLIGVMVYMSNTYNLMIAGGGQVGLMMAYAVAPFVLGSVIRKKPLLFVVSSIAFIIFDIRYAYILYACLIFIFFIWFPSKERLPLFRHFIFPSLWIVAANLFWLIPLFFSPAFGLPDGYGNPDWLRYLSWAELSKTISLLHPNWPENIFGKTYFMKPEFLLLPIFVFSPFIFSIRERYKQGKLYAFFAGTLLVGAFLAKGVNPPFPEAYEWLFVHMPLFNGFRDPTKFYLIIAISYMFLIPMAIDFFEQIVVHVRLQRKKPGMQFLRIGTVLFWSMILLFPFWQGKVRGTFERVTVPSEYLKFERLVQTDSRFYRTMAVPWRQRFVMQSEKHPLVNMSDIVKSSDIEQLITIAKDPSFEKKLQSLSVRYIVIPSDTMQEIFLTDRVYDDRIRSAVISAFDTLPYLSRKTEFSDLVVYEYGKFPGHFYFAYDNLDLIGQPETRVRSTLYYVDLKDIARPTTLYFSEAYDPGWVVWDGEKYIESKQTPLGLNSFTLDSAKTTRISVWYRKESMLNRSYTITVVALVVLFIITLGIISSKKQRRCYVIVFSGIVLLIISLIGISKIRRPQNLIQHPLVVFSPEWYFFSNPISNERYRSARFGGSTIHFGLTNATYIQLKAEGANPTLNEQVLEIRIGDTIHTLASPFPKGGIIVPLSRNGLADVRITLYCGSALIPCEVRIPSLTTNHDASVRAPRVNLPTSMIAVLGDSITSSFGKHNYSTILAEKLGIRLHNAGVFGSSVSYVSDWDSALGRVQDDVTIFTPDTAIIFLGTNDLGRSVPLPLFEKNYRALISVIKQKSPKTNIICLGLLFRKDFSPASIRAYSDVIKTVAAEFQVPYIDPWNWLSYQHMFDDVHPSQDSQEVLAQKLFDVMRMLPQRQ